MYNYDEYDKELKFRLQVAHANVLDMIQKCKVKRTEHLNRDIASIDLKIGDKVYLKLENRSKLDKTHSGPYTVTGITVSNATISNNTQLIVHKSRLIKIWSIRE